LSNRENNPGSANLLIGGVVDTTENLSVTNGPGNAVLLNGVSPEANREIGAPRWHSRGYLPHFVSSEVTQHVTFHLTDSLPQTALQRLEAELKTLPAEKRDAERRKRIDAWIDAGHGSCVLRNPGIAEMVQGSLLTFDSQRYRLLAWVVMPNHVHILFQPMNGWTVAKIVAAWKKFTARKICDVRQDTAETPNTPVWHREYWDRYIRDQTHLERTIAYIHENPVKARLAVTAALWRWSSAYPGSANLPIGSSSKDPSSRLPCLS
jgi:REP element-mobilizing transposase RayT